MRKVRLVLPAVLSGVLLVTQVGGLACQAQTTSATDIGAVQASIRAYYAAYSAGDAARYRALVTSDYVLLEYGAVMTLADDLKSMPKPGKTKRNDTIDFLSTKVVGDVAYAHWSLASTIGDDKGTSKKRWLESGVLRRSDGVWKVALLHSTRVEK